MGKFPSHDFHLIVGNFTEDTEDTGAWGGAGAPPPPAPFPPGGGRGGEGEGGGG